MRVRERTMKLGNQEMGKGAVSAGRSNRQPLGAFGLLQRSVGNRGTQALIAQSLQMKANPSQPIQRLEGMEEEEEEFQMKADPSGKADGTAAMQRSTGGYKMPPAIQAKMEAALGADFSDVIIHEDSSAASVGAIAYTQGSNIHFSPGRYNPGTASGQELLGHELAHVVQQREGRVRATGEAGGLPLNDSPALESEADRKGSQAARSPDAQ